MSFRLFEPKEKSRAGFPVRPAVSSRGRVRLPESRKLERKIIYSITVDRNLAKISINGVKPVNVPKIIRLLAANGIVFSNEADLSMGGSDMFSFSVPENDYQRAAGILSGYKNEAYGGELHTKKDLAMLSVVGSGAAYDSRIAALFYDTLLEEKVEIHLISLSGMKISALVDGRAADRAVSRLRARFMEAGVYCPSERTVMGHGKKEDIHGLGGSDDYPFYD